MRFLISAGEASGEAHGAQLIHALRALLPQAEFFGVGGAAMRAAGCDTVVDARQIAVVGLAEVVTHLPKIYGEFHRLLGAVDQRRPDAAILIDFPDFNFRLARQLHARGIPVFYYISPQLWAWRRGRIRLVRKYVRQMLVIFPFEEQFYREQGVEAIYVGHPLADSTPPSQTSEKFAAANGLDAARTWIALLPGSRRKEVGLNLPLMLESAHRMGGSYQYMLPVASTLETGWVRELLARHGGNSPSAITLTADARATLAHARAAIVASGTATLEAALLGTPFVMVYRVSLLSWAIGRRLVQVPHFGIVNLVLGRRAVPELVQKDFQADQVAIALAALIPDGPERAAQLTAFTEVRQKLHPWGEKSAACRAAETILLSLRQQ